MNFRTLPKIELHLHLDCCLSYEVVRRLAPEVTPEAFARDFVAPPKCQKTNKYVPNGGRCRWTSQTRHC